LKGNCCFVVLEGLEVGKGMKIGAGKGKIKEEKEIIGGTCRPVVSLPHLTRGK